MLCKTVNYITGGMRMKKIPIFVSGLLIGSLLSLGVSVGASNTLQAITSKVSLVVDGTKADLSTAPVNVNGKLYLPVRDTASVLGYDVGKVTSQSVELKSSDGNNTTSNASPYTIPSKATTSIKIQDLESNYTKGDKLDSQKIAENIANGKLTINSQDASTGDSLLHLVIRKNDYATYLIVKKNALNVNIKNSKGQTPVHEAIIQNSNFYLGELLNLNASTNIKDNDNKKPIDYADKNSSNYQILFIHSI